MDDAAKEMLEMVPAEFRRQAVAGTEAYARSMATVPFQSGLWRSTGRKLGF